MHFTSFIHGFQHLHFFYRHRPTLQCDSLFPSLFLILYTLFIPTFTMSIFITLHFHTSPFTFNILPFIFEYINCTASADFLLYANIHCILTPRKTDEYFMLHSKPEVVARDCEDSRRRKNKEEREREKAEQLYSLHLQTHMTTTLDTLMNGRKRKELCTFHLYLLILFLQRRRRKNTLTLTSSCVHQSTLNEIHTAKQRIRKQKRQGKKIRSFSFSFSLFISFFLFLLHSFSPANWRCGYLR